MNILKENLFKAINIGNRISSESKNFDSRTKQAMSDFSSYVIKRVNEKCENGKVNATLINSYKKDFLVFWSESTSVESEMFWKELKSNNIEYERKDPLLFALTKNRFINVHQGMDARKNWKEVVEFGFIKERYTDIEINKINEVIEKDEYDRIQLIKKGLKTKKIPSGMRFSDSMAYFNHCQLFSKYLKNEEVDEIYSLIKKDIKPASNKHFFSQ